MLGFARGMQYLVLIRVESNKGSTPKNYEWRDQFYCITYRPRAQPPARGGAKRKKGVQIFDDALCKAQIQLTLDREAG
jgi:hypothetical protein